MNKIILFLLIWLVTPSANTQDTTAKLKASMFGAFQEISLSSLDGWMFRQGNDSTWAQPNINLESWKKMNITELSSTFSDSDGRVEGWFRIDILFDSSFNNIQLSLNRQLWAATDIYIDGLKVESFGFTGVPYLPYNPNLQYARNISISQGDKHTLAVHIVNYETTLTPRELRLTRHNLKNLLLLTGPRFNERIAEKKRNTHLIGSLCVSVSCLLLLLFLLLQLTNPKDKIFKLASILTGAVVVSSIGSFIGLIYNVPYHTEKIIFIITNAISLPIMHVMTLITTEWVLKRKISWITKIFLIVMPITSGLGHLFNISWPFGVLQIIFLAYFAYLISSSRKTIIKEEWTVVLAMLVLTIGALIWVFMHKYYFDQFYHIENLVKAIVMLSAPILLLIYVSLTYKRIIYERQVETEKVIRMTEEKKLLLESQNVVLEAQVNQRTKDLQKSLSELTTTQTQLIQSEKMASLGELTAGIAHEIQNPLNFVNNFSEVSNELIDEVLEERSKEKGKRDEELESELLSDIKQNLQKINQHGQRASSIVKGMLEHSRKSTGKKESTDINALCDEYLRLAYHGLRAKDNTFNATMNTNFDTSLEKINVIPQDIGRVILNLINNAFYAVNERSKSGEEGYEPVVTISTLSANTPTSQHANTLTITISDNGLGIPNHIKDKIFQPFFTTKPTGQGTGLGLSLSYDIVKAHGGELKVETKEGEGTVFIIQLPTS